MAHRHKMQAKKGGKCADGGGIKGAEMSSAKDTSGGFKHGGKKAAGGAVALKRGGHAEGEKGHNRLDRKGRMHKASGGSALSSAAKTIERSENEPGSGKESVKVGKGEPSEDEPDRAGLASGGAAKGSRNWIAGATKNKGALHRSLGVPEGEKIPAAKLKAAEHSDNPKTRKRAVLAETLKGMH